MNRLFAKYSADVNFRFLKWKTAYSDNIFDNLLSVTGTAFWIHCLDPLCQWKMAPETRTDKQKIKRVEADNDPQKDLSMRDLCSLMVKLDKKVDSVRDDIAIKLDQQSANIHEDLLKSLDSFRANIETKVETMVIEQSERIDSIESSIDNIERISKLNDVIIRGVAYAQNEYLLDVFESISKAIGFKKNVNFSVNNIFRLKRNGNSPILVQFVSQLLKRQFMVKYFAKKNLNLSDIGHQNNNNRIYCSDNLTASNNRIYNKAVDLMKAKMIVKVHTRQGFVFVRYPDNENFVKINLLSDLPNSSHGGDELEVTVRENN